jgi:hypothetical protein
MLLGLFEPTCAAACVEQPFLAIGSQRVDQEDESGRQALCVEAAHAAVVSAGARCVGRQHVPVTV